MGVLLSCATSGQAATAIFDGTNGSLDLNVPSGSVTVSGITVTLSASDGTINATASGLGINDSSSGDNTSGLDTINTIEFLTLSFNVPVTFDSLSIGGVGSNDGLRVSFNGGAATELTSSGTTMFGDTLLVGQSMTITAFEPNAPTSNNGVSILSFSATQVPEPSTALLVMIALGMSVTARRR
ncbi:MAG: PEP-CTERM sorting domain-containing protein [Verrucomicrobiae bacterium]|nr:PEP-CTERM sorting domain-containing protein [Verrucomicrobiae bacterium]